MISEGFEIKRKEIVFGQQNIVRVVLDNDGDERTLSFEIDQADLVAENDQLDIEQFEKWLASL